MWIRRNVSKFLPLVLQEESLKESIFLWCRGSKKWMEFVGSPTKEQQQAESLKLPSVFMLNSRDYSLLKKQSSFAPWLMWRKWQFTAALCHSLHTKLELCMVFPLLVGIISFFHTTRPWVFTVRPRSQVLWQMSHTDECAPPAYIMVNIVLCANAARHTHLR